MCRTVPQDDSIVHICTFLNTIEDLSSFELTCTRIRRVIVCCGCWSLGPTGKTVPSMGYLVSTSIKGAALDLDSSIDPGIFDFHTAIRKYVARVLSSVSSNSLLRMWPLCATSYDNNHENLDNVISPIVKSLRGFSYWSSVGTDDESSGESLAFALDTPLTVIQSISVRPFQAWFQDECPIYGSKKIQFRIGGVPMFEDTRTLDPMQQVDFAAADLGIDGDNVNLSKAVLLDTYRKRKYNGTLIAVPSLRIHHEETVSQIRSRSRDTACCVGQWDEATATWTSPQYDLRNVDELQTFTLPGVVCVGGYVRIDLIGRNSRQEIDNKYYTCLGRVCITGQPLPGFYATLTDQNTWNYGFNAADRHVFSLNMLGLETQYEDSSSESEMYTTQHQFNAFLDSLENNPPPTQREFQASLDRFQREGVFIHHDDDQEDQDDAASVEDGDE